jgi:hypothetical protein
MPQNHDNGVNTINATGAKHAKRTITYETALPDQMRGKNMSRSLLKNVCLGLFVLLFATACDEATAPEGDPPEIPPQASLVMDFSDFLNPAMAASSDIQMAPAAGSYWIRSAVVVGVWNIILTGTLAPPVAAFVAAAGQEAEWDEELDAWTWSYNFTALGVQHSARLEARLDGNAIQWEMYISRDGSFSDFLWYTGESYASGLSGTWTLYRDPDDPIQFIRIDWSRSSSGETSEITYTNIEAGAAADGSYITYGITGETPYDAFYDLYGAETGNRTDIEWNRTTKEGRTKDLAHFEDDDWRCWAPAPGLENTTCN